MKEHPIIFSGEMVRAILAGKKTQTRRVMKPQPDVFPAYWRRFYWISDNHFRSCADSLSPYGQIGDRLWVRETWKPGAWNDDSEVAIDYMASPELTHTPWRDYPGDDFSNYHQKLTDEILSTGLQTGEDGYFHWEAGKSPLKWRPSIFMPRWASRIILEITNVRVERVQGISARDACAEGVLETDFWKPKDVAHMTFEDKFWDDDYFWTHYPQMAYSNLWDKINAKRGYSWDTNPWVWVIEFKRIDAQKGKQDETV